MGRPAPTGEAAPADSPRLGRPAIALAAVLVCLALGFASWGLVRLNTWYLASDQFAFLTLADDIRNGTVFHDDWGLRTIKPFPREGAAYDALAQTYYWRDNKLFTRYPPGFSILLAAAGVVGGEAGQHLLNPVLYLFTLLVLAGLTWTLVRESSPSVALGAGVAAMWLFLLLPTRVHLWGITVARDLPAHMLGLLALTAAARRAPIVSAAALGLACTVRPDAALYLVSIVAIFAITRPTRRDLVRAGVVFAVCASPVFIYNLIVEGSPFRFTQGAEFRDVLGFVPSADGIVNVVATPAPSGGAFRLANLPTTLPGNGIYLASAFGWFTGLVIAAIAWSTLRHRLLAAALVPYAVVAFLFYSCWSHPDARYLAGVAGCLIPLAAVGAALLCDAVARAGNGARLGALVVCGVAIARAAGMAPDWVPTPGRAGAALAIATAFVVLRAWTPGLAVRPQKFVALAPAVAFALLGIVLVSRSSGRRDPFQYPQVQRAREVVEQAIPAGSLVVTSTSLGRPAENLRHYSGIEAFYTEELGLVQVNADTAAALFALQGRRTFYLFDARDSASLRKMTRYAKVRVVEKRVGPELLEWYVDPRRAPAGAVLYEVTLPPEVEARVQNYYDAAVKALEEGRRTRSEPAETPVPDPT